MVPEEQRRDKPSIAGMEKIRRKGWLCQLGATPLKGKVARGGNRQVSSMLKSLSRKQEREGDPFAVVAQ